MPISHNQGAEETIQSQLTYGRLQTYYDGWLRTNHGSVTGEIDNGMSRMAQALGSGYRARDGRRFCLLGLLSRRRAQEQARREEREYELVRKRYLDEGLDQLIGNVQNALSAYQQVWDSGLSLLKQFREFQAAMNRPTPVRFLRACSMR